MAQEERHGDTLANRAVWRQTSDYPAWRRAGFAAGFHEARTFHDSACVVPSQWRLDVLGMIPANRTPEAVFQCCEQRISRGMSSPHPRKPFYFNSFRLCSGGAKRDRTADLLNAIQVLHNAIGRQGDPFYEKFLRCYNSLA
ncbi:MAG: hypothetical protein O7I42_24495 [Alphaproteobacteria bacterium]|nr:hypothetical protein [Alphaproteobacteria bacterium]